MTPDYYQYKKYVILNNFKVYMHEVNIIAYLYKTFG